MEQPPSLSKERRHKKGDKKGDSPRTRAGTSKKLEIMMEQIPFLSKERRDKKGDKKGDKPRRDKKGDKKGDKPRKQSRNQEEPENHDGTKTVSTKN